jgi:ArsR family transcriptional regulator, arsenate/arsenite/antimonite-responsive transcriptional repressor
MNISTSTVSHASGFEDDRPLAARMAALSHPARIEIVRHLARAESCCCRDVVQKFDLAQSTVSQHLKILVEAGLVTFTPDRQRSRYQIDHEALAELSDSLAGLVSSCCSGR